MTSRQRCHSVRMVHTCCERRKPGHCARTRAALRTDKAGLDDMPSVTAKTCFALRVHRPSGTLSQNLPGFIQVSPRHTRTGFGMQLSLKAIGRVPGPLRSSLPGRCRYRSCHASSLCPSREPDERGNQERAYVIRSNDNPMLIRMYKARSVGVH